MTPVFGSKIMNLLVFYFEPKKGWVRLHRVCVGGVGQMLLLFMCSSAIFAMLVFLVTLVTPWYLLPGVQVGVL